MDAFDFSDRLVLVVGGSSGIGNAIAQRFCKHGADVTVWGTRPVASDYAGVEASDLSGLRYERMDVSDFDAIDRYRPPPAGFDVVVLCQGTALYKREEFKMVGFRRVVDVNLNSLMACATRLFEGLRARRGSLIIVSSAAAFHSTKGNPAYNASKTGAFGLTRTLADAWCREGIRVNGIAPGLVATKLTQVTTGSPKRLAETLETIPMGRLGTPDEMAGVALFLASPLASYIVGQTILVDGGAGL